MDQAEKLRNVIKVKDQNYKPNARVITVTSGKGGVGKSNVAVNLAVQMQKQGKKVLIFDADFGLANVEVMFGAIPKYNMSDLIYHEKGIRDIITENSSSFGYTKEKQKGRNCYEEYLRYDHCGRWPRRLHCRIIRSKSRP